MPEFSVGEEEESYTLEGISGMVIMDRVKDDGYDEIKKGESATSGSRSENSENE